MSASTLHRATGAPVEDLRGRIALITGGSQGIGAGIALDMASAGARIAVNYAHRPAPAADVVARIRDAGGEAMAIQGDVSDEPDVTRIFAETRDTYGPVDLLVNNAAVWNFEPIVDVTVESFRRHYDTNVLGNVLTSREFARQPEADHGAIVNLTSVGIDPTEPNTSLYIGTKMAIVAMTRVLAIELAPRGIRVNAIAAGLIDTEGTRASGFVGSPAAQAYVEQNIPLGRIGDAADVASVATFLASDRARFVTGQVLFADGGASVK